ncbi:uncharacterized protein FTOL_00348 [Fusarium torulosum]|uniref:Mid2 domain-containing protein n=1 Tax=Fusarium torulosum TaxID=33205 RepID=A0AAE8SCB7_9HYPO|nr:uncharacterized protein FTOL_00348 [Fusarium torulosum]
MIRPLPALIAAVAFAVYGRCESEFTTPGPAQYSPNEKNRVYTADDQMNVEWKTDYEDDCNLFTWLDYPRVKTMQFYKELLGNTTDTSFAWNVTRDDFSIAWEISEDAVFHFVLYSSKTNIPLANSASFNVSRLDAPPDSSGTSTSVPTLTTPPPEPPVATSLASKTSDQPKTTGFLEVPAREPEKSGLSTAALVGISVGVTVAGLLISGAIGFFLWRRFDRRRNQMTGPSLEGPDFLKPELGGAQVLQIGRSELDSTREPQELWDTQKLGELGDENKIRSIVGLHEAP